MTSLSSGHMTGSTAPPPRPWPERFRLPIAFLTLWIIGTDLFVVSPLLPAISDEFHISPGSAGNSVTAFAIAYTVAAPLIGGLADRIGRRAMLTVCLVGFAVANVLTGLVPTFALLLAARVLAGLFASGITPCVLALVGQSAPPERRGTWMSTAMAGFLISLTTGAPSGTALAAVFDWKITFALLGALALVMAVANRLLWPQGAGAVAAGGADREPVALLTKIRAVSVTGLWAFAVYAFYTYLVTGLEQESGFTTATVGIALVVYGIGAVIGSLGGGRLADRLGAGRVATASLVLLALVLLVLAVVLHGPPALILVVLGVFALAAYPCLPSYQSRLVSVFGAESGSVLAWNSSFMYLGTSLGAAAGGLLLSTSGFRVVLVVCAVVAVIGAIVYQRALPRRNTAEPAPSTASSTSATG